MERKTYRHIKGAYRQTKEPKPKSFPKTYMKVKSKEVSWNQKIIKRRKQQNKYGI
jgi:hypothetical protein